MYCKGMLQFLFWCGPKVYANISRKLSYDTGYSDNLRMLKRILQTFIERVLNMSKTTILYSSVIIWISFLIVVQVWQCWYVTLSFMFISRIFISCSLVQIFHKRMPPEAIDLASRLLQYSPSLRCTAVSSPSFMKFSLSLFLYIASGDWYNVD